jgi:hypothetical protein
MKNNFVLLVVLLLSASIYSQQFQIGDRVAIKSKDFRLLDYSSSMKVHTYQYVGKIKEKYLFERKVVDVIVGVKNGVVVTTIYNLELNKEEHEIKKSTLALVNKRLGTDLHRLPNNDYAATIGNKLISLQISYSPLTFDAVRLVYFTSIKYSVLMP